MKASRVAQVVATLLATDAKPSEASILAAILAADKKGKDEGGLGPVEIEKKAGDKAKDEFPPKDKAEDEDKDDKPAKDADPDMDAEDEDDDKPAKDADVQPKKSASGNEGNGGKETSMDKKGMDAAVKVALDARDALHAARRDVETVLGVVAYDSAAEVYRAALAKLGVDAKTVHSSALKSLFDMARDKAAARTPVIASDAAAVKSMSGAIKGYDRLK